ncbi:MAG TPA: hypothetical protein VL574_05005 [Stellaceae bacterium]|jgi:hypothetical protein|nr:hypothetical protein [Stellaceae bacterium]
MTQRRPIRLLAIPLLGALLSGCAANPSFIGTTSYLPSYTPGEPMAYGAVRLVIGGTLLPGVPDETADAAVLAAMQDQGMHETHFTLGPVPRSPYAVVVAFDAPRTLESSYLCLGAPVAPPPGHGHSLRVVMALCRGNERLAGADGHMPRPTGVDDPVIHAALAGFVRAIVPMMNPERPLEGAGMP